jgi:nicotinamide-nucleotide amidase
MRPTAAVVTVGSELVEGLRIDTNTAVIARALAQRGFSVVEAVSVADDTEPLTRTLTRLTRECSLVVTTGGLGPTHDDVTREASASALGRALVRSAELEALLQGVAGRHQDLRAAEQVLTQADVIEGADVIKPTTGTAPGQVVALDSGATLILLPGPPTEMLPMLQAALAKFPVSSAEPRELGVVGLSESDAQVVVQRALVGVSDVGFTVLARPGDVRVLLIDEGIGEDALNALAAAVATALGHHCYSDDGRDLAQVVVDDAVLHQTTFGFAESCTGGTVAARVTSVPGSSQVFVGAVVAYANEVKASLLDVPPGLLAQYGAVSEESARAMAEGAREALSVDIAVSVTGIAGPDGGSPEKPVGLVWLAVATAEGSAAVEKRFLAGSRQAVRDRAAATALDLLRRTMRSIPLNET